MSWIDTLFGGGRAKAGQDMYNQLNQGFMDSQSGMNPYMNNRQDIYNQYLNAINQGQNPVDLYNKFASQYQMSPQAQAQIQQGIEGANRAAAASGMLGSGAEQTAASNISQSVRSDDFNNYMNNVLGLRSQYLGGVGGLEGQGFQGSEFQEAMEQKYREDMAKAQAGRDMGRAQGNEGLLGSALGLAGSLFGGGLGGAPGAGIGAGIGNWIGSLFGGGGNDSYDQQQNAYGQLPSDDEYNQFL
jgi:hypothetical protein